MNRKGKIVLRISKPGKGQSRVVLEIPRQGSSQKKNIIKHAWNKSKEVDQYVLRKIKSVHKHVSRHIMRAHETARNHIHKHIKKTVMSKTPLRHHGMTVGMRDFLLGVLIGIALTALFALLP